MRAKKSLGQNFIHDNNFIMKLSSLIISNASTNIFEVGPGKGALTNQLSKKKFKNLFLIEKDEYLFNVLKDILYPTSFFSMLSMKEYSK